MFWAHCEKLRGPHCCRLRKQSKGVGTGETKDSRILSLEKKKERGESWSCRRHSEAKGEENAGKSWGTMEKREYNGKKINTLKGGKNNGVERTDGSLLAISQGGGEEGKK